MPQGQLKTKVKIPKGVTIKKKEKGKPVTKRINAPVATRKSKNQQAAKLKRAVSNAVNSAAEEELRSLAFESKQSLMNKQKKKN